METGLWEIEQQRWRQIKKDLKGLQFFGIVLPKLTVADAYILYYLDTENQMCRPVV